MRYATLRATLRATLPALALAAVAGACGDNGSNPPPTKSDADLTVLVQAPTAPALSATVKSFWAKRGEDREIRLFYRPRVGSSDSTEYLRFRVGGEALLAYPGGAPIAVGDSVLITVTVPDPTRFFATFEPSGLRFAPSKPAELRWKIAEVDEDLDHDGDVDSSDLQVLGTVGIWRQEAAGLPWVRLASQTSIQLFEVEAAITGFSNYAVAY